MTSSLTPNLSMLSVNYSGAQYKNCTQNSRRPMRCYIIENIVSRFDISPLLGVQKANAVPPLFLAKPSTASKFQPMYEAPHLKTLQCAFFLLFFHISDVGPKLIFGTSS